MNVLEKYLGLVFSLPSWESVFPYPCHRHCAPSLCPGEEELAGQKYPEPRKTAGIESKWKLTGASQVALVIKNLPANAGDLRDVGSIPGSGRFPGGEHATHSSILAWRNPMDRGACGAMVLMVIKSQTWLKRRLSMHVQKLTEGSGEANELRGRGETRAAPPETWVDLGA